MALGAVSSLFYFFIWNFSTAGNGIGNVNTAGTGVGAGWLCLVNTLTVAGWLCLVIASNVWEKRLSVAAALAAAIAAALAASTATRVLRCG